MTSVYTQTDWVFRADVEGRVPGREDPPELGERCWNYLARHHLREHYIASQEAARKAGPALAAAKVLRSAGTRTGHSDLEKRLAEQEEVISRLLAFVPTRARPLEPKRMKAIVVDLLEKAHEVFPKARQIYAITYQETAEDTEACERIVVTVADGLDMEPDAFVAGTMLLHRHLAERLASDEYRAVNLIVDLEHSGE